MTHQYKITQLYIYPIKGMAGISLASSLVDLTGLRYDRQWMLIDSDTGRFLSQRNFPSLALIAPSIQNDIVTLTSANGDSYRYGVNHYDSNTLYNATVWDDEMKVCEVSKSASKWISNKLDTDCKLVTMAHQETRSKSLQDAPYAAPLNFPDGYPILIIGTASIDKLQSICGKDININRFRPNIVVSTVEAHEEDNWNMIGLENNDTLMLKGIKPCIRCQVINIDQSDASIHLEPTKTLAGYRRTDKGIAFGLNTICLNEGHIQVGDTVLL